jgi:hypothetical protein
MEFLKNIIHRIKYTLSYAYRIERGWGLDAIRSDKELEAVIKFCKNELLDTEYMELNPERKRVYEMTILLYEQSLSSDREVYAKLHDFEPVKKSSYNDVEDFITDHVGWYWN